MISSKVARLVGSAIKKHSMISHGDKILIALSGGKDSLAMLDVLSAVYRKSPVKFNIVVCTIDTWFERNLRKLSKHVESLKLPYIIRKTSISKTLESNIKGNKTGDHCFLCSRLRRGFLYTVAQENQCNKIALGHNLDDRIETFLLNIFYSSNCEDLRPKYMSEKGITVIRPLIDVPEQMIIQYAKEHHLPVIKSKCPFRPDDSKRRLIKKLLKQISGKNKYFYSSIRNGLDKNATDTKD